jgi:hypothetical protein
LHRIEFDVGSALFILHKKNDKCDERDDVAYCRSPKLVKTQPCMLKATEQNVRAFS